MLHMFINAILQEGTVISVSLRHVSVCKWIQKINRHKHSLPYLIENKIYNSNVTIQMICTLFVSLFMCIHKSCFICNLPFIRVTFMKIMYYELKLLQSKQGPIINTWTTLVLKLESHCADNNVGDVSLKLHKHSHISCAEIRTQVDNRNSFFGLR